MIQNQEEMMQEMQQQEEYQQQPMPYVQPQVPSEILEIELNFDKSLEVLQRKLKGETQVMEGKQLVWTATEEPWMNNTGVHTIIGMIRSLVDVNTFLTQLTETDINESMYDISNEITTIIANRCVDWEIDLVKMGWVQYMIENTILFALKRATGALTLRQIHSTTSRIEHPLQAQAAQARERKGFLGRFF